MTIQWSLALYSLFAGLSIGPFILLVIVGARDEHFNLGKWASLVSLGCLAAAGISAFSHLGQPLHAINVFANPQSGMMHETVAILVTGIVSALLAASYLWKWFSDSVRRILAWAALALDLVSIFLIASAYMLASRIAWNTALLPVAVLFSAVAVGLLLAWVLVEFIPQGADQANRQPLSNSLRRWALPAFAVSAVSAIGYYLMATAKASQAGQSMGVQVSLAFWLGLVVIGLLAPAGLVGFKKDASRYFVLTAFALTLVGGLVLRLVVFPLGVIVPVTTLW